MRQEFKKWLINIKKFSSGSSSSYVSAINKISKHYSENTGKNIDIYSIKDQIKISEIAADYSQHGRFSAFGYEGHSLYRAAISRYSEFFSMKDSIDDSEGDNNEGQEVENVQNISSSNFIYEKDLETALCAQISELFPGYKIFGKSNEGVQYLIEKKRIDVLLEHITSHNLLVVELKAGDADYRIFGQISMYIGMLQKKFPDKSVSGVIVAGTIDESLRQACDITDKVSLKIYRMSLELEEI